MGQAFDRGGNVLGEAYGDTKREVFDKLTEQFKDAHEIRIRTLEQRLDEEEAKLRAQASGERVPLIGHQSEKGGE